MTSPLFSIITVTRNAQHLLPPTLESIAAQRFSDYELIIQDGNSTDETLKVVNDSNIPSDKLKIHSEKDSGIYDAMNKGVERAKGIYLIFLNAGDSFHSENTLALIAESALSHGYPDIIYGQTQIVDSNRHPLAMRHLTAPPSLKVSDFAKGMVVCHQAFISKREISGKYDLKYRFSADYKWCIDCLAKSSSNKLIDTILVDYLFGGTTDNNRYRSLKERFSIMCGYYGFLATIVNHLGFIPRFLKRRKLEKKFITSD